MATAKKDLTKPQVQGPSLLSVEEASKVLAVSVATVYRYMAKGILPFHKTQGRRLVWQHEVETCKDIRSFGSPEEFNRRRIQARAAAHALHSLYDSRELTAAARDAFLERFERGVDPDRVLARDERLRRADQAKKAYFTNLAFGHPRAGRGVIETGETSRRL